MKFVIKHEIKGRIRIHILQSRMTFEQADTLEYYLSNNKLVTSVKVKDFKMLQLVILDQGKIL
jgi:hypothetical protein